MQTNYIIVQAGGKGTRMKNLTVNKPKPLVSINNLPMLFYLFRKYPDQKFIIISDYKYEVMKKYLRTFAKVNYLLVDARGFSGTCAGIEKALTLIPENESFMLIWSDLILTESFQIPNEEGNYLGLSTDFECRWKYENGEYAEERSVKYGVAGLFIFQNSKQLKDVPKEGEFVRWLKEKKIHLKELPLSNTKEYGLISEYNKLSRQKCRPFNRMTIEGTKLIKEGIDDQGKQLALKEKKWYQFVAPLGFGDIPKIYSYDPFVMEKINGKNIYEYQLSYEEKKEVLKKIVDMLKRLHSLGNAPVDYFSLYKAYVSKTFDRLAKVRDLIPFSNQKYIVVNDRRCHNVFFFQEELEEKILKLECRRFVLIHGDCTFSNMMLRDHVMEPLLIDPRGYFGDTEMFGDVAYDWAKLYYSIAGNYDKFNNREFTLTIGEEQVSLDIASNGWEDMEEDFFQMVSEDVSKEQIKLLHGIIWLSLTTYAWDDYDSICGAFYNGLYHLEDFFA